jgi:hypothetical protein
VVDKTEATTAPAESATAKPKAAPTSKEGRAEALKALTSEATNGDESSEEPEKPATTPAPPKPKDDETQPEGKPAEPEADPLDRPLSKEELADKKRTAERFQEILADRRTLRAPAKLGQSILKTCATSGMTPETFGAWTALGVGAMAGDPEAIAELRKVVKQYDEAAGDEPPAAPAAPKSTTAPGKLPDWLQAKVDNFEMSAETATEVARHAAPPAPVKNTPPPAEREAPPVIQRQDPAVVTMNRQLGSLETGWETEFKTDWPTIRARAWAKVQAAGKAAPEVLVERVKGAVAVVVAEMRAKAKATPRLPHGSLPARRQRPRPPRPAARKR